MHSPFEHFCKSPSSFCWQVGKTESILHSAEGAYQSIIYINFVDEPKYKLIMDSGYKVDYTMHSMDFKEFLWAKGYDSFAVEEMQQYMEAEVAFQESVMKVYSNLFFDYFILGGMPAVVREYIRKGTFEGTLDIQRQLLQDYRGCIEWLRDAGMINRAQSSRCFR